MKKEYQKPEATYVGFQPIEDLMDAESGGTIPGIPGIGSSEYGGEY